ERHSAAPAIAGSDKHFGLIEKFHVGLAFQTLRVSWVSICSTSASRARQSRVERPVWVNPSMVWMAREAELKTKTPDSTVSWLVAAKNQSRLATTASLMMPRFQKGRPSQ